MEFTIELVGLRSSCGEFQSATKFGWENWELTKERLKATQSTQKENVDNRKRDLEFEIGDHVFLEVLLIKFVMRLKRKWKT